MPVTVVLGNCYGDEAKAKVSDYIINRDGIDMVIRASGGANAGHTVIVDGRKTVCHLLPCGILSPGVDCVLSHGMVINPATLIQELKEVPCDIRNIFISEKAHIVLPWHKSIEQFLESGVGAIGTTGRGIGLCYEDKVGRIGIRMKDLLSAEVLQEKIIFALTRHALAGVYNCEDIFDEYFRYGRALRDLIVDTDEIVLNAQEHGKKILVEGAQAFGIDIDHGDYPFVTSSSCTLGGVFTGSCIGPRDVSDVVGVTKAYSTRVGNGPFATEMEHEDASRIREKGREYGATTGRPRRIGWLDLVQLKQACRINHCTSLAMTKLDVFDGEESINVKYPHGYETHFGWENSRNAESWDTLPQRARDFINRVEEYVGVKVMIVSVGPERHQTFDIGECHE